jgi:hypothetical protein
MNLLAIETSTELGSIALWRDGDSVARVARSVISHSETLLPLISGNAAAKPGSALPTCTGSPSLPVPARLPACASPAVSRRVWLSRTSCRSFRSVRSMRWRLASGGEQVIVVLDARMGEVYHGRFVCRHERSRWRSASRSGACRFPTRLAGWPAVTAWPPIRCLRAAAVGCVQRLAARTDARCRRRRPSRRAASGARRGYRCGCGAPRVRAQQGGADGCRAPGQAGAGRERRARTAAVEMLPMQPSPTSTRSSPSKIGVYPFPGRAATLSIRSLPATAPGAAVSPTSWSATSC